MLAVGRSARQWLCEASKCRVWGLKHKHGGVEGVTAMVETVLFFVRFSAAVRALDGAAPHDPVAAEA